MSTSTSQRTERAPKSKFLSFGLPTVREQLGNMGWPILLKQLRVDFRRNRFFISHFASLGILGCWLIILIATETSDPNITPTQVGQKIFNAFVWIQAAVVFFLFPVFSSTAFTDERTHMSLDLLLITTLRPSEIVWGKFLAATVYCLMYILATVPLLAISFLFGGVHVGDVLLTYVVLIGLTLLVSMLSLCVSASSISNVRATMTVYVILLSVAVTAWFTVIGDVRSALDEDGSRTVVQATLEVMGVGAGNSTVLLMVFAIDLIALFTYLLLFTTNRIRPITDDRSSKLRILTFLYFPVRLFFSLIIDFEGAFDPNLAIPAALLEESARGTITFAAILLLLITLTFPTEDANLSRRVCDKIRAWGPWVTHARIFAPGPFSGFVYTLLTSTVVCVTLFWAFEFSFASHLDTSFRHLVFQSMVTLPIYFTAFASLGFLLSVSNFTPLYSRLTVTFVFIITLLLPMIFFFGGLPDRVYYFYFISPLVLWESLDRNAEEIGVAGEDVISYQLWGFPIISIANVVFASIIVFNLAIGVWIARNAGFSLWSYAYRKPETREKDPSKDGDIADELAEDDASDASLPDVDDGIVGGEAVAPDPATG